MTDLQIRRASNPGWRGVECSCDHPTHLCHALVEPGVGRCPDCVRWGHLGKPGRPTKEGSRAR